ncbi:MAG: toxin-antitoxin system TumE family protein [Candidatus Brocadiales bacterium]
MKIGAILKISEAIHIVGKIPLWLSYRYYYQDSIGNLVFRYDSVPHHPETDTYPEHKHLLDSVIGAARPNIELVLKEVKERRQRF